jgi:hypothetical protein
MADLVANITVAQFAPAMAYAACFVSPLIFGSEEIIADNQGGPYVTFTIFKPIDPHSY